MWTRCFEILPDFSNTTLNRKLLQDHTGSYRPGNTEREGQPMNVNESIICSPNNTDRGLRAAKIIVEAVMDVETAEASLPG